jgi:hypothetical protein
VSAAGLLGQLWRPFPKDVSGFLPHIRGVSAALIGKTQHKQLTQVEKPADDPARPGPSGWFRRWAMCSAALSLSPSSQTVRHSMATRVLSVAPWDSSIA